MTSPIRLVVADDHPVFLAGLQSILDEAAGFHVVAAVSDGEAAIDAVAACQPDVVLMDLRMPGMDGLELVKKFHEVSPDMPSVMITAQGTIESAVQAMRQGWAAVHCDAADAQAPEEG